MMVLAADYGTLAEVDVKGARTAGASECEITAALVFTVETSRLSGRVCGATAMDAPA